MPREVKPIPDGFHTVTPYLTVNDAARAIDFYKRAFGAQEKVRMQGPPGKVGHAELKIGDSIVMLADEMPGSGCRSPHALGGSTAGIFLYVKDVDAAFKQAVSAGAKVATEPADMFWGDRFGRLTDPFGHVWSLATHKEDVTPEEMQKRSQTAMSSSAQKVRTASE
jgi:PhnB protein